MQDEVIQRQLLVRGLHSPYIAKEILAKNYAVLFPESTTYQIFARILALHFSTSNDPLTEQGFKLGIEDEYERNKRLNVTQPDKLEVFNELESLLDLEEDTSQPVIESVEAYAKSRLTQALVLKIADTSSKDPKYDITKALHEGTDKIDQMDITGSSDDTLSVFEDFDRKREIYKDLVLTQLPMGLKGFDEATNGGLAKGECAMLASPSGFGKTSVLSNISISYVKQGYNVFHISLEEIEARMSLRFDRILLGKGTDYFLNPHNGLREDNFKLTSMAQEELTKRHRIGHLYFKKRYPQQVTVDMLRQYILSYERSHEVKIDVVVIDYPDLLLNEKASGDISMDGGRLYQRIKYLAQDLNCVVWTASQLNRTARAQEIMTLESVEGSYQKKNILDFACTLNRTKEEYESGFMRLYLDKVRNRENFQGDTLYFKYDRLSMRIRPETEDEKIEHANILNEVEDDLKDYKRQAYKANHDDKEKQRQEKADKFNAQFGGQF